MFNRHITPLVLEALRDTPVVVVHGARQTGKSTLVQHLAKSTFPAVYYTLDQAGVLAAARSDPDGFIADARRPLILDEVQRAPELLLAIKAAVDRDRRTGRFLLTGSAHVLQLPLLADSLAGRMQTLTLHPLSQGEIRGVREGFIDTLFASKPTALVRAGMVRGLARNELARCILAGGYPEALLRKSGARRRSWFESYIGSILLRDIRDLANIAGIADIPNLLSAAAGRAGGVLNYAELGRDVGLNQITTKRYLTLLSTTFIIHLVKPWFTNRVKRVMKSEKLYFGDSGMLAHVLDITPARFARDRKAAGVLLENFVAVELLKQASWSRTRPTMLHFRDYLGHEVDLVLEAPGGNRLVGIEVKTKTTLDADDFKGLRALAQAAGDRFLRGIVLYTGEQIIPFGRDQYAVPLTCLWDIGGQSAR